MVFYVHIKTMIIMGKLTQYLDYMNIHPDRLTKDYAEFFYTHFTITDETKRVRRENRWYRSVKEKKPKAKLDSSPTLF